MIKRWIAAALAAGVLACNLAFAQAKDVSELAWVEGPTTAQIAGKATLKVPEGYAFLDPAGAREFNRLTENPDSGVDEYVLAKDDLSWVAFFTFDPVGYVKHLTAGAPIYMWPIMIPVEIMGMFVKPFALALWLFANMTGGHIIIAVLLSFVVSLIEAMGQWATAWP